jgi:hypothetical protein
MVNLKKSLNFILNSKSYKFIIYLLIGFILIFLICGNYNLIEGMNYAELREKLASNRDNISKSDNQYQEEKKKKFNDLKVKNNIIKSKLPFSNLEGMGNRTQKTYITAGINPNLGIHKANSTTNKAIQQYQNIKT